MENLTPEEKLKRARISIINGNPFFAYLSLYLKFEKDTKGVIPENAGMGVSPKGLLIYKESFVDSLTEENLVAVLLHEILHLSLIHLLRRGNRQPMRWNCATDLATNSILKNNGYNLPKGLIPDMRDEFTFTSGKKTTISGVSTKSAEQLYEEIPEMPEQEQYGKGSGRFDVHLETDDGEGGKMNEADRNTLENEWLGRCEEAYVNCKKKGSVPAGIDRYLDNLKKEQIDWKTLLRKYITTMIPIDNTWTRRSKKSMALGTYMPDMIKEKIEVVISIDTSGSIGKEELTEFLTEVIGMARAYQNSIDMRLLAHDSEVQSDLYVRNGNIEKIKKMELKGGGGTSHKQLFDYIDTKIRNTKVLVAFTDGFSDIEEIEMKKYNFSKIFVINKNGTIPTIDKTQAIIIKCENLYK